MRSQETERKRIAGELHDSLVQNLLIVKNRALLGQQASNDPHRASKEFSEITTVITGAIDEVRGIAHNLRPYQIDRLGLTRALKALVESLNGASATVFMASIENVDGRFKPDGEILVYRIVQEATNNILKHAAASSASVSASPTGGAIEIAIRDNGKGLGADPGHQNGFGLTNVEQRVHMLGGALTIHSSPGTGTTLIITIPVTT
jgi:signal transduction histidine kinase